MVLGQLRGPSWVTDMRLAAPIWEHYRTGAGWEYVMTLTGRM